MINKSNPNQAQVRFCWQLVLPMIFFFSTAALAQAQDTNQVCKLPSGTTWYFSLERTVYHVDINQTPNSNENGINPTQPIVEDIAHGHRLAPPDPSSPLGCKNNPQQLSKITALNWPVLEPSNYAGDLPKRVYILTIRLGLPIDQNVDFAANNSNLCGLKFGRELEAGTIYCTNKPEGLQTLSGSYDLAWQPFSLAWRFLISKKLYTTPLGGELQVAGFPFAGVSASYFLNNGVTMEYRWNLPLKKIPVEVSYVIASDKLIRKTLESFEVMNYPWPAQNSVIPSNNPN